MYFEAFGTLLALNYISSASSYRAHYCSSVGHICINAGRDSLQIHPRAARMGSSEL